jgi:uncharacterized protein YndB with AHSA1/START domain
MTATDTLARSVSHGDFTIERTYSGVTPQRVFDAFASAKGKDGWFTAPNDQWEIVEREMDFRVGGRERLKGRWEGGVTSTFDAVYHDIVPNERLVYTYEMHLDDRKISVSLATLQLKPAGARWTTLSVTEQGAFLDGYDDAGSRERGTGMLLDRLGESLRG